MSESKKLQLKFDRIMDSLKKTKTANSNMLIKRSELNDLKLYRKDINGLIEQGYLEKVRQGWYQVVENENEKSEAALIAALFPDGAYL